MRLIFSQTSIRTRRKYRFLISSHLLVLSNIVIMEKFLLPFIIMIDSCIYTAYVSNVYRCAHYMFFADCVKRNLILIRLFLAHSTIMVKTKRWIFFLITRFSLCMCVLDLFAAFPCCQARLSCSKCFQPIVSIKDGLINFSNYSSEFECGHCGSKNHHFVKPFDETFDKRS